MGRVRASDRAGRISEGAEGPLTELRGSQREFGWPQKELEGPQRQVGDLQRELRGPWRGRKERKEKNSRLCVLIRPVVFRTGTQKRCYLQCFCYFMMFRK